VIRPPRFPVLATARLELRAPTRADAGQLFEVFSDPEVMRYWSTVPMRSTAEAETMVANSQEHVAAGTGFRWAVCRREDARVMGTISIFHFDEQNDRAEIGYALGRAFWGRGFMHEALTALVGFAFGDMDLRRLEADTDPRNAASIRALERLGFVREGLLRERWVVAGVVSDSLLLGLLRSDWIARQVAGA
jgi:[ribosomal protein S5]-alanine N-acetyltransferase